MNLPQLEWHTLDNNPAIEFTSLLDGAEGAHGPGPIDESRLQVTSLRGRNYELIVASILIYGLVGFFIWQKTERRISDLESEIGQLQSKLPQASESIQAARIRPQQDPLAKTDILETEHFSLVIGSEIRPQWRALAENLQDHLRLEYEYDPNWRLREPSTLQRRMAQKPPINLIFTPGSQYAQGSNPDPHPLGHYGQNIQYEAANLLIEFIVAEYGTAQLLDLLNAFKQHESWQTLAPALFNLSAEEFEQEWHAYLAKHYRH